MTFTQEEIDEAQRIGKERKAARRNKKLGQLGLWLSGAFVIVILDQLSKWAVTEYMIRPAARGVAHTSRNIMDWYMSAPSILPYTEIKMTSFFNIVMVWNTGVSFGILGGLGKLGPLLLILLAIGITFLFTMWLIEAKTRFHRLCYILVIGGALGNIIDRARFGAVIDFLDFHVAGYHWPAFNIADSAVVIGIAMLIGGLTVADRKRKTRFRKRLKDRQNKRAKYMRSL